MNSPHFQKTDIFTLFSLTHKLKACFLADDGLLFNDSVRLTGLVIKSPMFLKGCMHSPTFKKFEDEFFASKFMLVLFVLTV